MSPDKHKPAAASRSASLLISAMVAAAVVLIQLWPDFRQEGWDDPLAWLNELPAPAAGIAPQATRNVEETSVEWVIAASEAEGWLAEPGNQDFLALRNFLTNALIHSSQFDRYPLPVTISLADHAQKETIKYLVDSRPGVMSVIYYSDDEGKQSMLVYWPEVAGDSLVYTPLGGGTAKLISDWVNAQVARVERQGGLAGKQ
ncbi:MAG: hypothetical protein IPM37_05905 [Hahellaceae bacterium]|nr:hypothetical protein [Hahellaceae bacterium]